MSICRIHVRPMSVCGIHLRNAQHTCQFAVYISILHIKWATHVNLPYTFSNICSPPNFLYKLSMELTFENLNQVAMLVASIGISETHWFQGFHIWNLLDVRIFRNFSGTVGCICLLLNFVLVCVCVFVCQCVRVCAWSVHGCVRFFSSCTCVCWCV